MARASKDQSEFLAAVSREFGVAQDRLNRAQIQQVCSSQKVAWPHWLTSKAEHRAGRGVYSTVAMVGSSAPMSASGSKPSSTRVAMARRSKIPVFQPKIPMPAPTVEVAANTAVPVLIDSAQLGEQAATGEKFTHQSLVPTKARGYVPFGHFNTLKAILSSGIFYPAFVTGLSGNGKTMMLDQICANLDREMIRVNITAETDEDDLLGGFRLQDGKTVWQHGPVVVAMERGAVLLLDEVDLGTNKLMCLQPVLEGKPVYLKKINKVIYPNKGFNVVATANTKGQGSMDGKFVGTNVLNEAFLERFPITIEQEYPSTKVEEKILIGSLGIALDDRTLALDDFHSEKALEFVSRLVSWADGIRKLYREGGITEIISTRRLVHIINAFVIFDYNRRMSIELCLNRFDVDTKNQFIDLFSKIDPELDGLIMPAPVQQNMTSDGVTVDDPKPTSQQTILEKMAAAAAAQKKTAAVAPAGTAQAKPADWNQTLKDVAAGSGSDFLKGVTEELEKMIATKGA